ncbi:MAG: hypothetical protein AAGA58_02620 [Verrucomicrobiota bacterium]
MARQKNTIDSVQLTVSVSEAVRDQLEEVTRTGLYGKNAAETANFFITEKLRDLWESNSPMLRKVFAAQENPT